MTVNGDHQFGEVVLGGGKNGRENEGEKKRKKRWGKIGTSSG